VGKTYRGVRRADGCEVTVDGEPLAPRLDLRNHSPAGFEFGYEGSGPAQLALAILVDHLGEESALAVYQEFKRAVVARLEGDEWSLSSEQVNQWWETGNVKDKAQRRRV
jgi:hypothetical protein